MSEKLPKAWAYLLIVLVLLVGALIAGKIFWTSEDSEKAPVPEEGAEAPQEREEEIRAKDQEIARLRQELEEVSKKAAGLQARLDETAKALFAAQERLKAGQRESDRSAQGRAAARERPAPRREEPPPSGAWRSPAEPGIYETVRTTPVLEQPSESSRAVSTINRGTRVEVVGSRGDWLEVRSRRGNPPGFIRRDDAMFVERAD